MISTVEKIVGGFKRDLQELLDENETDEKRLAKFFH